MPLNLDKFPHLGGLSGDVIGDADHCFITILGR